MIDVKRSNRKLILSRQHNNLTTPMYDNKLTIKRPIKIPIPPPILGFIVMDTELEKLESLQTSFNQYDEMAKHYRQWAHLFMGMIPGFFIQTIVQPRLLWCWVPALSSLFLAMAFFHFSWKMNKIASTVKNDIKKMIDEIRNRKSHD